MPNTAAAIVFTAKSVKRILQEGGTSSWRLDRAHARKCVYAICTRNANASWVEGSEEHRSAFLVGKINDVVQSPYYEKPRKDRFLIEFSEYALVDVPDVWKRERNPVKYSSIEDLGIDPSKLKWRPMPPREVIATEADNAPEAVKTAGMIGPLTMVEAKKGLALTFGVSPDAIEITIRG